MPGSFAFNLSSSASLRDPAAKLPSMKILCDRTALQEAVNVVSSVVPVKTPFLPAWVKE